MKNGERNSNQLADVLQLHLIGPWHGGTHARLSQHASTTSVELCTPNRTRQYLYPRHAVELGL